MRTRFAACPIGAVDELLPDFLATEDIELPPVPQPRHRRDIFHPVVRHRALDERYAGFGSALRQRDIGIAHENAVEASWRNCKRERRVAAQHFCGNIAARFVGQREGHRSPFCKGFAFPVQCGFLPRAALEIFKDEPGHELVGPGAEIRDRPDPRYFPAGIVNAPGR